MFGLTHHDALANKPYLNYGYFSGHYHCFSIRWCSMNISTNGIIYVVAFVLILVVGFRINTIKQQLIQINEQVPTQSEATHIHDLLLFNQR